MFPRHQILSPFRICNNISQHKTGTGSELKVQAHPPPFILSCHKLSEEDGPAPSKGSGFNPLYLARALLACWIGLVSAALGHHLLSITGRDQGDQYQSVRGARCAAGLSEEAGHQ